MSIDGANRLGIPTRFPELLVFGARARTGGRARTRPARPSRRGTLRRSSRRTAPARDRPGRARRHEAVLRESPSRKCRRPWRPAPGCIARPRRSPRPSTRCAGCRSARAMPGSKIGSRTFNTERIAALELSFMLDITEAIVASALHRQESRGAHQRTDFTRRDDDRFLAHSVAERQADGSCRVGYLPVTITRWPPGERIFTDRLSRIGDSRMSAHITLRVARYQHLRRSPRARSRITRCPVPGDWVVLDGLDRVEDRIDGTLSSPLVLPAWASVAAAACLVNGEPKLTCATFLADYAPGPLRVEPLLNFPVIRDLDAWSSASSWDELTRVKPWIVRQVEKPLSEGEYRQTPRNWTTTSRSACASTACSVIRPVGSTASIRISSGRRPSRSRSATTSTTGTRGRPNG